MIGRVGFGPACPSFEEDAPGGTPDNRNVRLTALVLLAFGVGCLSGSSMRYEILEGELVATKRQLERFEGENNKLVETQVVLASPDSAYSFDRLRARLFWTMPKSAPELAPSFNKEPSPGFPTLEILGVNYDTASR